VPGWFLSSVSSSASGSAFKLAAIGMIRVRHDLVIVSRLPPLGQLVRY
jgi:hypothetical protein